MAQSGGDPNGSGRRSGALFDETFGAVGCAMVGVVLFALYMLTLVLTGFLTALRPYSFLVVVIPTAAFLAWRIYRRRRR